jgi:predicted NodU family carbamoyl transferase
MDGGGVSYFLESMPTFQEMESIYYINKKEIKKLYGHLSNARFKPIQFAIPKMQEKSYTEKVVDSCKYVFSSNLSSGFLFSQLTEYLGLGNGSSSGKTMGLAAYGNPDGNRPEDLAHKLQLKTEKNTKELIDYASKLHNCKNIILSGGYAMNCLNNYKYVQSFPNLNFFVDPCAWDGGTSIGAAIWLHRELNKDVLI